VTSTATEAVAPTRSEMYRSNPCSASNPLNPVMPHHTRSSAAPVRLVRTDGEATARVAIYIEDFTAYHWTQDAQEIGYFT